MALQNPLISVIMPNFNDALLIGRAINAILSQSYKNLELIVVDDASTDNSLHVLSEIALIDKRVRLIKNSKNIGALASVNKAIPQATGDYICFQSADDEVMPGFFGNCMKMAGQYPRAGIIFGPMISIDNNNNILREDGVRNWKKPLFASPDKYLNQCLRSEPPKNSWHAGTIYKRSAFMQTIGKFSPSLGVWADTFSARAVGLKYGVCYITQPAVACRVSSGTMSSSVAYNIKLSWALANRVKNMMLSDDYKNIFPNSYVKQWALEYKANIILLFILQKMHLTRDGAIPSGSLAYKVAQILMFASRRVKKLLLN